MFIKPDIRPIGISLRRVRPIIWFPDHMFYELDTATFPFITKIIFFSIQSQGEGRNIWVVVIFPFFIIFKFSNFYITW